MYPLKTVFLTLLLALNIVYAMDEPDVNPLGASAYSVFDRPLPPESSGAQLDCLRETLSKLEDPRVTVYVDGRSYMFDPSNPEESRKLDLLACIERIGREAGAPGGIHFTPPQPPESEYNGKTLLLIGEPRPEFFPSRPIEIIAVDQSEANRMKIFGQGRSQGWYFDLWNDFVSESNKPITSRYLGKIDIVESTGMPAYKNLLSFATSMHPFLTPETGVIRVSKKPFSGFMDPYLFLNGHMEILELMYRVETSEDGETFMFYKK
jgi:hypothetical protein